MSDTTNQAEDTVQGTTSSVSNVGAHSSVPTSSMNVSSISNPLAALVAAHHQPQGYPSLDSNTALLMSNAAATIGAVAAQAMKQMAAQQQQQQHINTLSNAGFPASLYAALQGSHNNPLVSATSSVAPAPASLPPSSHAALLAALAGGGQQQSALTGLLSTGSHDTTAGSLLSSSAMVPQPTISSSTASNVVMTSPALLSNMQSWTLEQLEQHVTLLQHGNQSIPQSVALLLAEAQRKQKKKNAKRVANRKSASTSRARKKALVEEMTKTNVRLKRQALILALLPDLVITTTPEGEITFCSAQVERILQYKSDDLIGAKLFDLVVPSSREPLKCLIEELIHPGKAKAARASAVAQARRGSKRRLPDQRASGDETGTSKATEEEHAVGNNHASEREGSDSRGPSQATSRVAAVVSEQSFPLSVVEVESTQQGKDPKPSATNENLDTSTNNSGASGEDDSRDADPERKKGESKKRPRSDDSSSLSSDAKNLRANDYLDRNVRWHNQRILKGNNKVSPDDGPKDDVTGASVTANNAGARLSSLKHVPVMTRPQQKDEKVSRYENAGDQSSSDDSLLAGVEEKKKNENASDDSGYRESNDSREETSSSGSDTSQSNDFRKKYMVPSIRLCLVRDDLTTVWCEVTSSIRDCGVEEEAGDEKDISKPEDKINTICSKPDQKELLLCLRPVRDGDKKVDESFRFFPINRTEAQRTVQDSQDAITSSDHSERNTPSNILSNRPPKKRGLGTASLDTFSTPDEAPQRKRSKVVHSGPSSNASDTEKSVVESLLKMNQASL